MSELTHEERQEILKASNEAMRRGDVQEAIRVRSKMPLLPGIAKAGKDIIGIDAMKEAGFNLSAAEKYYGEKWLAD